MNQTYDCLPTLNHTQVMEFCKNGFLMLDGVVSEDINQKTLEYVNEHPGGQPVEILLEDWFLDGVIKNPDAAGAVRSLLGKDFRLPNLMANHSVECPVEGQDWHRDGGSKFGPELQYLQVFYYPEECPREMGPTELLPGSHFLFSTPGYMGHYGNIKDSYYAVASAGSIFLTIYNIWHRRSASTVNGIRNNLKYNYWRTSLPERDWLVDPNFDLTNADWALGGSGIRDQFVDVVDAARMYTWLRGKSEFFNLIGGQGWPIGPHRHLGEAYGIPEGLELE